MGGRTENGHARRSDSGVLGWLKSRATRAAVSDSSQKPGALALGSALSSRLNSGL